MSFRILFLFFALSHCSQKTINEQEEEISQVERQVK